QIVTATSRTKFYYGADNAFGVLSGDPKSQYGPWEDKQGQVQFRGDATRVCGKLQAIKTVIGYNSRGMELSRAVSMVAVDGQGNETLVETNSTVVRTFDAFDRLTSERMVVGLDDSDPTVNETNDLTTTNIYDSKGNLIQTTDPRGRKQTWYYDAGDSERGIGGLLRWEIDTNGNSTTYSYSEHRPVQIVTATSRTKFYYGPDNSFGVLSGDPKSQYGPYTYVLQTKTNDHGDVTMTGDAHGNTVYNTYEDDGTLSHSIRSVLNVDHDHDPETPDRDFEYKDVSEYDDENRIVGTRRLVRSFVAGATPSGDYLEAWSTDSDDKNPLGQDETVIDQNGNQTFTTYDERGLAIQTVQATSEANVYLVTRTVYDSKGRALVSTDSYRGLFDGTPLPGVVLSGTRYTYDAEERATKTEQIRDFSVVFDTANPDAIESSFSAGAGFEILSTSESDYNSSGWLTDSTDDHGLKSTPTYNRFGETVESRSESRSGTGALVTFVSRTVYDDKGRVVVSTDSQVLGSTDPIHGTITVYDAMGRAFETRRVKGLTFQLNPDNSLFKDANGNFIVTGQGETLSLSRSEYNDRGQVTRSISETFDNGTLVNSSFSDFEYDEFGRRTSTTGPASLVDGSLVRHRTETDYQGAKVNFERTNIIVNATTGTIDDDNARTTRYKYDEDGNVVRTTYHDGSFTAVEFDKFGRKVGESQMTAALPTGHFAAWDETTKQFVQMNGLGSGAPVQVGIIATRSMEYDAQGRLLKVTLPAVLDTRTTDPNDMTRPFYEYGYDRIVEKTGEHSAVRYS
ncbi:MAG: hypothetical protein ABL888_13160, partial [Pirellulaceae bacterium]